MNVLKLVAALSILIPISPPFLQEAEADHAWGSYHWEHSTTPINIDLGDNVDGPWDGHLGLASLDWNVSNVTDMSSMFQNTAVFNRNLSGWDTSNVTDMDWMFSYASVFNQNLGSWNIGSVTTMANMLDGTALTNFIKRSVDLISKN